VVRSLRLYRLVVLPMSQVNHNRSFIRPASGA
jgi:hypothetical protein